MCPKCGSVFFSYDPRMDCYVCRERTCTCVDRTKTIDHKEKNEKN